MDKLHVVSVRALAEYACASGSLTSGAMMAARMREGREGHIAIQQLLGEAWQAEAPVSMDTELNGVKLRVQGRADALQMEDDCIRIAEIKTTRINPYEVCKDDYPAHWAQGEIYAHLFCELNARPMAEVILIYAGTKGGMHKFKREFSRGELRERFQNYALPYISYLLAADAWHDEAVPTLTELRFPFEDFREGQQDMADMVYRAMAENSRALIEAPTGIGKTAASLFGALRALGEGKITRIFYLTARTTGRRAAENALQLMRRQGLKLRSVTVTAKEKVCFIGKPECGMCRYGEGYYEKRREALRLAMQREVFGPEEIAELAREFEICPFELSLDLTEIADVVICDYNYVFDPRVRLKRHFDKKNTAGILIDEAHNLPDRAREMYSASLSGMAIEKLLRRLSEAYGAEDVLCRELAVLLDCLTVPDAEYDARSSVPDEIVQAAAAFAAQAEKLRISDEPTVELMHEANWFVRVAKRFDDACFRALIRPEGKNNRIAVKLWCFAPENYIDRLFKRVGGTALFSATLAPIDFYARLLAVPEKHMWLALESPFPRENLFAARIPVNVKFREREQSMEQVVRILHAMCAAHPGNYLACFPSHAYLMQAYKYHHARFPEDEIICQDAFMSEPARQEFIARFRRGRQKSMLAFIVLGGVFAEGVDLPDELLSGAAIISTGMPLPNPESELLREMYDDGFEGGTDAAYTYPGFRRVLQAAGRVIRTETDRGVVLLLDARYAAEKYLELMPSHWRLQKITSMSTLNSKLNRFWEPQK